MPRVSSDFRAKPPSQQPYGRKDPRMAQAAPQPPARTMAPPRAITHEEAIRYLWEVTNHPQGIERVMRRPYRHKAMSEYQRQAAAIFDRELERADPTGKLRQRGEFILYFRLRRNKQTGEKEVRANGPIVYCDGNTSAAPAGRATVEGTFLCIHSHPDINNPDFFFPSPQDFFTVREARRLGLVQYGMVKVPGGTYMHFDGSLPPRFTQLHDMGPGYMTPPSTPDLMPPPLPPARWDPYWVPGLPDPSPPLRRRLK